MSPVGRRNIPQMAYMATYVAASSALLFAMQHGLLDILETLPETPETLER